MSQILFLLWPSLSHLKPGILCHQLCALVTFCRHLKTHHFQQAFHPTSHLPPYASDATSWRCMHLQISLTTPLRQRRLPDGAACQAVICRQPSFPVCCTSRVEQPALQSDICSVTVFISATSENILISTIFSGHHRDTLVDLAIVFFLLRPL